MHCVGECQCTLLTDAKRFSIARFTNIIIGTRNLYSKRNESHNYTHTQSIYIEHCVPGNNPPFMANDLLNWDGCCVCVFEFAQFANVLQTTHTQYAWTIRYTCSIRILHCLGSHIHPISNGVGGTWECVCVCVDGSWTFVWLHSAMSFYPKSLVRKHVSMSLCNITGNDTKLPGIIDYTIYTSLQYELQPYTTRMSSRCIYRNKVNAYAICTLICKRLFRETSVCNVPNIDVQYPQSKHITSHQITSHNTHTHTHIKGTASTRIYACSDR